MRTLKPTPITVLTAPFELGGRMRLVIALGVMFDRLGAAAEQEQALWTVFPAAPGSNGILDEGKPKTRAEWLLAGAAHAPSGKPAPAFAAKVTIAGKTKEIVVIGDRTWKDGVPTAPAPIASMPLAWAHAFGGEGYAQNPLGKGLPTASGAQPLPNLELAGKLVTSPRERPKPACFAPVDPSWSPRLERAGTHDKRWLDTRYPGPPEDLDPLHYQMAPDDQLLERRFSGGERFVLENLHPTLSSMEMVLPKVRARCFLTRRGRAGAEEREEIALEWDTVWLLPNEEKVIALFRGATPVSDELAEECLDLLAALEWADAPKPASHYERVRAERLDKKRGPLLQLRNDDLMPEGMPVVSSAQVSELDGVLAKEGLARKAMRRQMEKHLEKAREEMRAMGIDPDAHLPPLPPEPAPPDPAKLPEHMAELEKLTEETKQQGEKQIVEATAKAKAEARAAGVDLDAAIEKAKTEGGGPPKFRAKRELERLYDLAQLAQNSGVEIEEANKIHDPRIEEKLVQAERSFLDMYRRGVGHMAPAKLPEQEERLRLRALVLRLRDGGEPLPDPDLTGADLHDLDLAGLDLSGALLERADLRGARLTGARLDRAVLARADLEGADLAGASLADANLSDVRCRGASLNGADLTAAHLRGACLRDADLQKARLDRVDLSRVELAGARLGGAAGREVTAMKTDFSGVDFSGATFVHASFTECKLDGARFDGSTLSSSTFIDCTGAGASFRGAKLDSLRVARAEANVADYPDCVFEDADLRGAHLRGADLARGRFLRARLDGADLSVARLERADFTEARAPDARFMKADLTGAVLDRADLMGALLTRAVVRGARFEGANLFRADGAQMKGDGDTSFRGANVKRVRTTPNRGDHG